MLFQYICLKLQYQPGCNSNNNNDSISGIKEYYIVRKVPCIAVITVIIATLISLQMTWK